MKTSTFKLCLFLLASTIVFVGCKTNNNENSEKWKAIMLINENQESGANDTIDLVHDFYNPDLPNSYCTLVSTYYDKRHKKNVLVFNKHVQYGEGYKDDYGLVTGYVNEDGVLYESSVSPYSIKDDGTCKKNDSFWDFVKETSDCEWVKINENTAYFIRKSGVKQTWIFERDTI